MIKTVSLLLAAGMAMMVSGCSIHQSIGDSFGSAVREPHGPHFDTTPKGWNSDYNALLYVYRPATTWSMDEFESPSFNVNDQRLFNLKGGAYTWYQLAPGNYDVVMRRGLLGFEGIGDYVFSTPAKMYLSVQAGKVYYLRYSETNPPTTAAEGDLTEVNDGPLQLVSAELALSELPETRLLHRSGKLLAARAPEEDKDLQRVFDGQVEQDNAPARTNSAVLSSETAPVSAPESKAEAPASSEPAPVQQNESWWPF